MLVAEVVGCSMPTFLCSMPAFLYSMNSM